MAAYGNGQVSYLLSEAKQLHSEKEYEQTVQALTTVLESCTSRENLRQIELLDLRMGAYTKLKKFELAFNDAKSMIKLDRSDARGYLRCGQLERLSENLPAAIKWYEHGVKRIDPSDDLYEYLQTQLTKTRDLASDKIRFSKATDPMTFFPLEIVEMVFKDFEYRQLVAMLRVSKSWKNMLVKMSPLSDTISFRAARRPVTYQMLSAALKRLSRYPRNIVLANLNDAAAKSMRQHLERWVNYSTLQHLEVHDGRFGLKGLRFDMFDLKTIVIGAANVITIQETHAILKSCQKLEVARFENVIAPADETNTDHFRWTDSFLHENLVFLQIAAPRPKRLLSISAQAFRQFPNLVGLSCRGCRIGLIGEEVEILNLGGLHQLRELDISECKLVSLGSLPPSLVVFRATQTTFDYFSHSVEARAVSTLSNLQLIDVYGSFCEATMLQQVLTRADMLRELSYGTDSLHRTNSIMYCLGRRARHSKVQVLRLKDQYLTDSYSQLFIQIMPMLRHLTLENASITGAFLADLLRAPSNNLKHIILQDCSKVSPDTIQWMRDRGVRVDIQTVADQRFGGRSIIQHNRP